MLKISASSSGESSTTTRISVWGLKYVPGRLTRSSISTRRGSAIGPSAYSNLLELRQFPLHLGLDVQRRLPRPGAAIVARLDEIPDLGLELGVDGRRGQPAHLGFDVEGWLAAPQPPRVASLEHLADLLVALAQGGCAAGSRAEGEL